MPASKKTPPAAPRRGAPPSEPAKKAAPAAKRTPPAARPAKATAKKAAPASKKVAPAPKKAAPAPKKVTPAVQPPRGGKKVAPAPKKAAPAAKPARAGKAAAAPRKEPKPPAPKPLPPAKPAPSPFSVGDKVVYPHHGAAVIARKERLPFQGQRTEYFVLEVATDQLILKVPVHKAVEQGVRPVISQTVARKVLATFKSPPEEAGANWSRWYKLLTEKINSGDIFQVAEVVRDLTYAQQTKGISPALKRMLSKARLILASELRFALDVSEEEAMRRLDKSLPKVEVPEEF
jgi:CarD family transcriptional regulator